MYPPLSVGWGVRGMGLAVAVVLEVVVRPLFHGIWPFLAAEILARVELECVRDLMGVVGRGCSSDGGGSFSGVSSDGDDGDGDSSDWSVDAVMSVGTMMGGSMVVAVVSSTLDDAASGNRRAVRSSLVVLSLDKKAVWDVMGTKNASATKDGTE